jgi:hypothetical protein
VTVLPGRRCPELINDDEKLLESSFVVPTECIGEVAATVRGSGLVSLVARKESTLTTKAIRSPDNPARSRTVPIGDNTRAGLGLLRQACTFAQDAGADLWDFALEIGKLFETGLTISDVRWLVAKQFAMHGQELSVYGAPHRSFRGGAGFFFDHTTCVVLTPSGAAFVDHFLNQPVASPQSILPIGTAPVAGGATAALNNGSLAGHHRNGTTPVAVKPHWNEARRELTLNGTVVKRFRVPADNQEIILATFEEDGWPDHIDDPLPVKGDINPRTRLHDAINKLNGCQTHRLIRFAGNGTGTGVSWGLRRTD